MGEERNRDGERLDRTREAMRQFEAWMQIEDTGARAGFMERLRAIDPQLYERVDALVRADRGGAAAQFMEGTAIRRLHAEPNEGQGVDRAGEHMGPWRLVSLLGRGGMGEVWLAERVDGQYHAHAAIKLLRGSNEGAPARRRFQREGRILARLAHDHIARLLDAGESERGQRYLVLEWIEGERIDAWADRHRLSIDRRLGLFEQVCAAVSYAHSHLVVHRDLKPSNVLVQDDGEVKLLDFGVAKLLEDDRDAPEQTELTLADGVALTPEYASPEQIENAAITVASDVYSLGVLLYVLLAGEGPYADRGSSPAQWARAILEGEPRRLSGATGGAGEVATARAEARSSTPAEWRRALRGELETIVARALKKQPTERYASVAALAEDIHRYRENRPILARPDSLAYRSRKFARRHRVGVAVSILAILGLAAGILLVSWQAHVARLEAERSERSRTFLVNLIRDVNPFSASRGGQGQTGNLLAAALDRVEHDFADAPDMQAELRSVIALGLRQIGDNAKSVAILETNVAELRRNFGDRSPILGNALVELGYVKRELGDIAAARADFTEAEPLLRDAGPDYRNARIELLVALARLDNQVGDHAHALELHRRILGEREALQGADGPDVATDLMNIATDDGALERYAEAESLAMRADDLLVRRLGPDHARRIYIENTLGLAQAFAGHAEAGIATLRDAVQRARATLAPDAPMLGIVLTSLGVALHEGGDDDAALAALEEAHRIMDAAAHPMRGQVTLMLGRVELALDRPQALATLQAAIGELAGPAGADGHLDLAGAAHGAALARSGRRDEGEAEARAARARLLAGKSAASVTLAEIDRLLADIEDAGGATERALAFRHDALAVYRRVYGTEHPRTHELAAVVSATHADSKR
ncbi:serine/threonine-protein kinase [Dokdonella immobilis]|uniref:Serine/threonine protein kinase n=1 Tax=Dokdonella immobilis TaxID=578942 RepID=A0A1I4W950_9GAMM|nr:serine/threonine-protein kinase [Dokdonella immobilis]SFN09957.1 serine/threonine protein kinase [Dokdonella immobilis]